MNTVKLTPRGYCHGVVNAINKIIEISSDEALYPIYVLGMVVHNEKIVNAFKEHNIITLNSHNKSRMELLEQIDSGTVVFTAHGVGPDVYKKALNKGLNIIDTTCDDVFKSQDIIKEYTLKGYDIIFIGKHNHPEVESVLNINKNTHIVSNVEELLKLNISNKKIALTNQTTMSIYDIFNISEKAKEIYSNIEIIDEICNSTKIRQNAVINQEKDIDFCFVVGDKLSNNSNKLVEVSIKEAGINSKLISGIEDIDIVELSNYNKVSVTSGASTPTKVTKEVYDYLNSFDRDDPKTHSKSSKLTSENLLNFGHNT